jgi:MoaA/NifB/PqqE/SkfB family radical SAM enzyme
MNNNINKTEEFLSIPEEIRAAVSGAGINSVTERMMEDFVKREANNSYCLAEFIKFLYLFQKQEYVQKYLGFLTDSLKTHCGEIGILHKAIAIYAKDLNLFDEEKADICLSLILRNIDNRRLSEDKNYKEECRLMIKHVMVYVKRYYIKINGGIINKVLSLNWGDDCQIKNIFINEIEYHQGKIKLESKPRIAEITLTNRCNLQCKMCGNIIKEKWEMNRKGVDNIIKLLPYLESVNWYGGEVGLFKDFPELTNVAYLNNVDQNIITNGLVWTDKLISHVLRGKVSITVSIDGFDEDAYSYTRGVKKFGEVKNFLKKVNEYRNEKNKLMMNTILFRKNVDRMSEIEKFAVENKLDTVYILPLMCWREDFFKRENIFFEDDGINLKKMNKEIENAYAAVNNLSFNLKKRGIELVNSLPVIKDEVKMSEKDNKSEDFSANATPVKKDVCYAPWKHISVYDEGSLAFSCTCNNKKIMFGNINEDDIFEAWNCEKVQQIRKNIIKSSLEGHVIEACSEIGCFGAYY